MTSAPGDEDQPGAIADQLKAIAHDVRLKLLCTLLDNGETSVGDLEALTGIGQPRLSQQLAVLRKAGLVEPRRAAKLVYYRLVAANMQGAARLLCALAGMSASADAPPARRKDRPKRGSVATFARIL